MNKYNVTADEIVALLGRSETDDKILDLFEKLEIDRSEIESDEDDDTFNIELEEDIGLGLTFNGSLNEKYCIPKYIGGNYFVDCLFTYEFKPLPFGLNDEYNLEKVIEILGREPNFRLANDKTACEWIYEDLGDLIIEFEDETLSSIYEVRVLVYDNPDFSSEDFQDASIPFKKKEKKENE